MVSTSDIQQFMDNGGGSVVTSDGDSIGKVGQVFVDDHTGQPEWVTVSTGLFGTKQSFVPLNEARISGNEISVPYSKDQVKDAPRVEEADSHMTPAEEDDLYRYYNLDTAGGTGQPTQSAESETVYDQERSDTRGGHQPPQPAAPVVGESGPGGYDTSGPTTDEAMTRSEEQLKVGTQSVATSKARLRKFIVTEQQTVTVPVRHEEVTLEREPITDANVGDAMDGPELSEEEHEMVLHEEQVVVDKDVVPVERVTMARTVVTEDQQVTEDVNKEQIEHVVDDGVQTDGRTGLEGEAHS